MDNIYADTDISVIGSNCMIIYKRICIYTTYGITGCFFKVLMIRANRFAYKVI